MRDRPACLDLSIVVSYKHPINRDVAATNDTIRFFIDQPCSWSDQKQGIIIRGWCFAVDGQSIRAVRLRTDKRILCGVTGLPRPDVKATWPEVPDDITGFEIRGTLPSGRINFIIEAGLADGSWHELLKRTVDIKRQLIPLWLGGGSVTELIAFQMPAHMAYPARPVRQEKFPATRANAPRLKVSIVTPSFNQARFLGETIRSVLEQAGVACDYVVQDGGSTDGSVEIIRHHAGGLHAWTSTPDAGQADAIVKGFAKTAGDPDDLMAWINSDDFYLPGALACVVDYFARHPEADVLYGHRIVVNEESQEIARWFLPKHDPAVLRLNDFVPQETMFWRRRIWDKVGGLDTSFKFAMDWDLLLRFQAAGARIIRVPYFLACFRVHAAQKTSALMHGVGQKEITLLRERTHGRPFSPQELENDPRLIRYLRRSAFIESMWKLGVRLA